MNITSKIADAAKSRPAHIVLSEGEDPRVVEAAAKALMDGIARISLVGKENAVSKLLENFDPSPEIEVHDPARSPELENYTEAYHELRAHKGVTIETARKAMMSPLGFAAMMVRHGDANGTLGGATHTTADTARAALQIIGVAESTRLVSSLFLMGLPDHRTIAFADCALVAEPDAQELADIAIATAKSFQAMTGEKPKVAMLAFSTLGSARHPSLDPVIAAAKIVRDKQPDLIIDGEMQFDAAFVPCVGKAKAPGSPLQGNANVFVFPNLHAGNIGYKIAQRIGGATAIGPILQGLNKPANDLSRGCNADDIYQMIAVTAAQVNARQV